MTTNWERGFQIEDRGGTTLGVALVYPRMPGDERPATRIERVRLSLEAVRAAADLFIAFDYDRNGWVLSVATVFEWAADDDVMDRGLTEVAFVSADAGSPDE